MWSPQHDSGDGFFSAFPGHHKSTSQGSPWSQPTNFPPAWAQSSTTAPPPWATPSSPYNTPHSPTLGWNAPSPFGNSMELSNNQDHWNSNSGWGTSGGSSFGQPMGGGFFGANSSPNTTAWPSIIRSASEYTGGGGGGHASPPAWAAHSPPSGGWNIPRPKSAIGPGKHYNPSPSKIPAHLIPDTWDESNLARRPRDWRASYNPRASFLSSLSVLPSAIKSLSDVQEYADPTKRRMTPSLEYRATQPPIIHDLRLDPFNPKTGIFHAPTSTTTHRNPFTDLDMAQFSTTPPAKFLRLFHPKLPWYIDIHQTHPNGITVGDILSQLYGQLGQQILPRHYWNDVLNEKDRKDIGKAYKRRTDILREGAENGILWIDFLCGEVLFEGLVRHKGGLWEIKTRNAYQ